MSKLIRWSARLHSAHRRAPHIEANPAGGYSLNRTSITRGSLTFCRRLVGWDKPVRIVERAAARRPEGRAAPRRVAEATAVGRSVALRRLQFSELHLQESAPAKPLAAAIAAWQQGPRRRRFWHRLCNRIGMAKTRPTPYRSRAIDEPERCEHAGAPRHRIGRAAMLAMLLGVLSVPRRVGADDQNLGPFELTLGTLVGAPAGSGRGGGVHRSADLSTSP